MLAPDAFYAAYLMKNNWLYHSRGDFSSMLDELINNSSFEFKDVAKKLVLIKKGQLKTIKLYGD